MYPDRTMTGVHQLMKRTKNTWAAFESSLLNCSGNPSPLISTLYDQRHFMTPDSKDSDIKKLIEMTGVKSIPFFVDVTPEPYAKVAGCFPAVEEKVKKDKGEQVLGWQIWKTKILAEAEFHALWKSPEGELRDITPKQIETSKILFLPDPQAKYVGAQVDNIRLNITNNRLVDDFIEISKAIFRIENRGNRAFEYQLVLTGQEAQLHEELKKMKAAVYFMVMRNLSRNSLCFCESGEKYKHCHGHKLKNHLNRI